MLDPKLDTLLLVAEKRNFTRAAQALSLTQPAVSHHISQLEQELGVRLFVRGNGDLMLTPEGETVLRYARRMKALEKKMAEELQEAGRRLTRLRIGITHTAESSIVAEVLARYTNENPGISITIVTDNINNLYDMLENFELDLAVVEGRSTRPELSALMLDTDYLVCVLANTHPLSHSSMITLDEIRQEKLILRLPNSETRVRFESGAGCHRGVHCRLPGDPGGGQCGDHQGSDPQEPGHLHSGPERLYGRAAQGQAHCPAHREPEHGPGDQPGLSPGFCPQGDAAGYSGAVQKTASGIWPGLTEPGGSGIVVRYRE